MLYICIPVHNEAPTIGVLLWRLRGAFQEFAREYELVVYDDGSTDVTAEVLEPYTKVLPLTVLSGRERRGYAAALDALARHVAAHTRYPRRDAMIVMEGDFTDRPEHIPELVKRFEGGADIVVTERQMGSAAPLGARRLRRLAPWILRPFVKLDGVADLTSTYRLVRISAIRDLLRERGDAPLVSAAGWAANVELLVALAPHARRIESVPVEPRYEVRPRESRVRAFADAMSLAGFAWRARLRRGVAPRPPAAPARVTSELPTPDVTPLRDTVAQLALAEPTPSVSTPKRRTRPRREGPTAASATPASNAATPTTPAVVPTPAPADDEAAERRRRRRRNRKAARGEAAADGAEPPATPATPPSPEADEPGREPADERGPDEAAAPRARRSRRTRKRRTSSATNGGDGATPAPESPELGSGIAGPPDARGDGGDGDDAGAGAPAAKRRRSRRGRRRGARPAGEGQGDGGEGTSTPEPSPAAMPASDAP